jgi:hypothetical protein
MNRKLQHILRCALLVAIGLAVAGCEKLGSTGNVPDTFPIPASFGDLIAVTPTDQRWESVLWFKQSDQTIVAVRVNVAKGRAYVLKTKYPRS